MMKRLILLLACLLWTVADPQAQESFHILKYEPAPGQFIDYTQFLNPGQTAADLSPDQVCRKLDSLYQAASFTYITSLGGFGGSITVRLDRPVPNLDGKDFEILGNAFYDPAHTPQLSDTPGGSSEPGIIWVSQDRNGNGIADDPWYEIAGSEHRHPQTVSDYAITYFFDRDAPSSDIYYRSNTGDTGYIFRTSFHTQETYFPRWLSDDSITYRGRRLPPNARLIESAGRTQWLMLCYAFGYADNQPNGSPDCGIDLDWAVDSSGNPVYLDKIDFIKVVCATNQQPDLKIGEISTEFAGILSLHTENPDAGLSVTEESGAGPVAIPNPCRNSVSLRLPVQKKPTWLFVFDLYGRCRIRLYIPAGQSGVDMETGHWPPGLYMLRFADQTAQLVKS